MRQALLLGLVLCAQQALAQRLTGNSTGSGASCIPDPHSLGLGQGCPANEACCPTTNTCVKRATCSDFAKVCPPPTCGRDTSFGEFECPTAEVSKVFKKPKDLKCLQSSDTVCYTNGTAMVVACKSGAGSARVHALLVALLAAVVALLLR